MVERTNVNYLLQPALMVLMFINIRRVATGLLWAIDPNVAFYLTWFGCLCLINTGLATICCTFYMKGESPTYCCSIIICMCFSTTLFRRRPSRDYCLFYKSISTKGEKKIKFNQNTICSKLCTRNCILVIFRASGILMISLFKYCSAFVHTK